MLLDSFTFTWPWLFLLLPLPWLVSRRKEDSSHTPTSLRVPFFSVLSQISVPNVQTSQQLSWLLKSVFVLGWLLLITASARPQWIGDPVLLPMDGRDLMLAVDISGSMKEQDMVIKGFSASRIDAVKDVVSDFVEQRKGDRVGLILFGTQPYIQAPLTFDLQTVNTLLREATLGMAGRATAIGDAIGLAVKRLKDKPEQSRVLVLLTDGANTAGEIPPEKAAQLAQKEKIKIYTIGIGADEMVKQGFFSSRVVNPSADLDEETLTKIAEITGGRYFRAKNAPELGMIYESLNQLEPIEQEGKTFRPVKELYYWPLAVAIMLFFAQVIPKLRLKGGK
jgi:Ca-activated chloride channel family protein